MLKKIMENEQNIEIMMSEEDKILYEKTNICHIRLKEIRDRKYTVRNHCHFTGLYRLGPTHVNCNLKYKLTNTIPIVFHNLRGYGFHFMMQEIVKFRDVEINVIPSSREKYMSFTQSRKYLLK